MKADDPAIDADPEAPGDWSVDRDLCIACGAPPAAAPDLIGFGPNPSDPRLVQCYFKRQPRTEAEVDRACAAAGVSCVSAVRYDGPDPVLRTRVAEAQWGAGGPDPAAAQAARAARARRKLWLAVLVSVALLLLYQWLFPPTR